MMINVFNSSDFTTLNGGTDIETTVEAQNAQYMTMQNGTPYNMLVSNAGSLIGVVPPFCFATFSLPTNVERLTVKSDKNAASYTPANVTVGMWRAYAGIFIDKPAMMNYKYM